MIPAQASELIKKLKQLNNAFKNETDRKLIKGIIASISEIDFSETRSFSSILQNANVSHSISNFLNRNKVPYAVLEVVYFCTINNLFNSSDISFIIDCLGKHDWDHNSKLKILQMFFYFVKLDLDLKTCFQMLELVIFHFVSQNPDLDSITMPIVLQLVSIIISKQMFKLKQNILDCKKEFSESINIDTLSHEDPNKIFRFIFDSIITKKLYFASYILAAIVKNKEISKVDGFGCFLKNEFPSVCIEILKNGKRQEKIAIYDSILEVKSRFNCDCLLPIYRSFNEIYSKPSICLEFMSFVIDLLKTFDEGNEYDKDFILGMKETFTQILDNWDLLNNSDRRPITLLQNLIHTLTPQMNLDEIVKLVMMKIYENTSENLNELFIDCLEYCSNYNKDDLFEHGLICGYNGKVNRIENSIDRIYKNMGKFWHIYFANTEHHNLYFLDLFNLKDLGHFINSLPPQVNLGRQVYLKTRSQFILDSCDKETTDEKIKLFQKILLSTESVRELMELATQFYCSNPKIPAIEMPLNILIMKFKKKYSSTDNMHINTDFLFVDNENQFKTDNIINTNQELSASQENISGMCNKSSECLNSSNSVSDQDNLEETTMAIDASNENFTQLKFKLSITDSLDLYFFINEILRTVSLSQCWTQIFTLIQAGDECEYQKSQIILFIEQEFLFDLKSSHLKMLFQVLRDIFLSFSNYQSILNALFVFGEVVDFVIKNHRDSELWMQMLSFGLEISLNKREEIQSSMIKHLFRIFIANYNSLNEKEIEYFENILLDCTGKLKNENISLLIFEEWKICLDSIKLNNNIVRLLPILTDAACEGDEQASNRSFEVILIISKKIKEESYKEIELDKFYPFSSSNSNDASKLEHQKSDNDEIDNSLNNPNRISSHRQKMKRNSENSNFLKTQDQVQFESEDPLGFEKLIKKYFQILLRNCNTAKYGILRILFSEISSYSYSVSEIKELSKDLFKFVSMEEPYRNDAIDCFIKTCNISKQFTFCLKMLSSWLSKDKIDISLSLIDKISKNLKNTSEIIEKDVKVAGLNNFLDYSIQFSSSEDFLIPVFDLICKCDCIFNEIIMKKLLNFSQLFIIKQLHVKYTKDREIALVNYIEFLTNLTMSIKSDKNINLKEILQKIITQTFESKNQYSMFKLACYGVMFKFYECFEILLKNQINKVCLDFVQIYVRNGKGISFYLTNEILFILKNVLKSKNSCLIDGVKLSLIELMIINDYEILEYIRQILKMHFENE